MTNPNCPHCGHEVKRWSTPTFSFSDGLGWCTPWLWICFNERCPLYVNSWEHMRKSYGVNIGYRYMKHPDSGEEGSIPVGSSIALRGDIIDEAEEEEREQQKKLASWRARGGE